MQINVPDPIYQTIVFTVALTAAILLSLKKSSGEIMSISQTNQLKGVAILMVIFSHAGYFLSTDTRFLYPLSVAGGVGVNLFLFLSGFGLTACSLKNKLPVWSFYKKRLSKIFWPMWLVITVLLLADYFILGINYSMDTKLQSFFGFYPKAEILLGLNSPLWYFTPILSYYLIFPWVFLKSKPIISSIIILGVTLFLVNQSLPVDKDVLKLYKLHVLAFPLGMMFAILLGKWLKELTFGKLKILRIILILIGVGLFGYTAIHSGVGESIGLEERGSLVSMFSLITLFLLVPWESRLLAILGIYSYEIYLIQWPLMLRYDFLYKYLPAGIATVAYLVLYVIIGFCLHKVSTTYFRKTSLPS